MEKLEKIKVKEHRGTWYSIDSFYVNKKWYYLMEHETYGDEAAMILIDYDHKLIAECLGDYEDVQRALKEIEKPDSKNVYHNY